MALTHIWHGAVGIILTCVGLAIIGGVAYLLYSPDFSFSENSERGIVFSCPGMTFIAFVSDEKAHVSFSDGREFDMERDPPPSEVALEEEWARYAAVSGTLVFWYAAPRALIEQNGAVLYGECVAQ